MPDERRMGEDDKVCLGRSLKLDGALCSCIVLLCDVKIPSTREGRAGESSECEVGKTISLRIETLVLTLQLAGGHH